MVDCLRERDVSEIITPKILAWPMRVVMHFQPRPPIVLIGEQGRELLRGAIAIQVQAWDVYLVRQQDSHDTCADTHDEWRRINGCGD